MKDEIIKKYVKERATHFEFKCIARLQEAGLSSKEILLMGKTGCSEFLLQTKIQYSGLALTAC
jgi:hypothetical protein